MIRQMFQQLLAGGISRRDFIRRTAGMGVGAVVADTLATAVLAAPEEDGTTIKLSGVTGGDITCETLKSWGVKYVFGNTGAYEAGFVDALVAHPEIQYVLGLQEGSVMAMADGYARITGETSFVNVHSITGTANALGLIVNAWADNSPVVVSVGFSSKTADNLGVFTETQKLEAIPELYTKLSFRASELPNLGESLRQSFRLASMRPSGPVFIGIPADVWRDRIEETKIIPASRTMSDTKVYPDTKAVKQAVKWLAEAKNPLLIAGAELPRWGGLKELAALSEKLGATVSGDTSSSRSSMGFPSHHPRYLGALRRSIKSETPFDVVVLAGASRLSLARGGHPLISHDAKIIEFGIREDHMTRSYPADVTIWADAQVTLQKINAGLAAVKLDGAQVAARAKAAAALKNKQEKIRQAKLDKVLNNNPIAVERLAVEIDRALAPDAIVVTEGVSSDRAIWEYVKFDQPGGGRRHLISSGGSLGWGVGAGIGAKLGAPDKQVAVLMGDGSFQFGVQALWTAKRFDLPIIFVIFNNRGYQANRWALAGLKGRAKSTGRYIGISLDDPDIDHVAIAGGYGIEGERVTEPGDLKAAFQRATDAAGGGKAYVLDVIIAKHGGGADAEDWNEGPNGG